MRPLPLALSGEIAADEIEAIGYEELVPEPVLLQGTWADGRIVVWAAGRGSLPETNEGLADRLEASGGPPPRC